MPAGLPNILAEVRRASPAECRAYLHGAMRDGTFNRLHRTLRIAQADVRWLRVLEAVFLRKGSRSWIYKEGDRSVWVIESTCRLGALDLASPRQASAFARGYFDAGGGLPHETGVRFYIQFTQRDRDDLGHVHEVLERLGVRCGRLHNPSARADSDYWRFYVLAASHRAFADCIGSWHPRKRELLVGRCTW